MTLDFLQTLALAGAVVLFGRWVCTRIGVLERLSIPPPVVGGLIVALALLAWTSTGRTAPTFDTMLQKPLLVAFFASLGFAARLDLLRRGGPQVGVFLALCSAFAVLQSLVGIAVAWMFGLPSLFGVLVGAVTLTGGPATGAAFAPLFEEAGVVGAGAIAVASATAGIVLGGLLGGPMVVRLMRREGLRSAAAVGATTADARSQPDDERRAGDGRAVDGRAGETEGAITATEGSAFTAVALLLGIVVVGQWVSAGIERTGLTLPGYIGAMLVAAVVTNIGPLLGRLRPDPAVIEALGAIALSLFLAMWLMTLDLTRLHGVALPLIVNLVLQVALIAAALRLVFRLMGRDYDSAVMSGGFTGFMLGTTATALAVMRTVVARHGPAPRAFLVAPVVGAFFIDFTNALIINAFLNILR
jgi:glutamate:Na+ symporter, ESS family